MCDGWRDDEIQRREQVEAGHAAVANRKRDHALIAWAKSQGLYIYIGRPGRWGNPYEIGQDGDRGEVCDLYGEYLRQSPDLLAQVGKLQGRVLGCWCWPQRCHGGEIVNLLEN